MTRQKQEKQAQDTQTQSFKDKISSLEKRLDAIENKNRILEAKVTTLESEKVINENVTRLLSEEVDRLDQYHRRSNIIIANVIKTNEKESEEEVKKKVHDILKTDLKLPDTIPQIDKLHRIGKVRERNGKQSQDIIVRFTTHRARYQVYTNRKSTRNVKIRPNLTRRRETLRYEASESTKDNDKVNFVYADVHGDIKVRLIDQYKGKHVHAINSRKNKRINHLIKLYIFSYFNCF